MEVGSGGGDQIVTILPQLEANGGDLLEAVDIRGSRPGISDEVTREARAEDLVIHRGQSWILDILANIRVN